MLRIFKQWKKIDILIAVLFILTNAAYLFFPGIVFKIFLFLLIIVTASRLLILLKQKLLWKIRNRLLFSGLFFIATPIFFISIFFFFTINIIIAQYGITILDNVMNSQLTQMEQNVDEYLNQGDPDETLKTIDNLIKMNPDYFVVLLFEKKGGKFESVFKYPRQFNESRLILKDFKDYFMIDQKLYIGVLKQKDELAALIAFAVNQEFLDGLSTISDFKIRYRHPYSGSKDLRNEITSDAAIMDDENYLFPYIFEYKFLDFNTVDMEGKPLERLSNFLLIIDYARIYQKIKAANSGSVQTTTKKVIYFLIVLFGTFIVISFFIGFRMIRVITRSVNQITRGIQKIRNGDFSVRIKTKSGDQLQYLADSFNEMAAGIDRLLKEEKERQRLEEELRIARSIQLKLLPPDTFDSEEFEIAAINIPAAEIAGDYFDYFYKENKYLSPLVADVSGKGASAAFYMAELKGLINYLLKRDMSPASLICECHDSLIGSFDKITFITMSIAKFVIPERRFILSRAGHTPAIFFNAREKECVELFPEGAAIGLKNFSREKLKEIDLEYSSGDILLLYSDGLSEILNKKDEMIGVANLKNIIRKSSHLSAVEIKQKILDFSIKFSASDINRDDLTFIVLKVRG